MPAMSKMSNLKPQRLWANPKDLVVGARRSRGDPVLTRKRNPHWLYKTTIEGVFIPRNDLQALFTAALSGFNAGRFVEDGTDNLAGLRSALAAIGVLPKMQKSRKKVCSIPACTNTATLQLLGKHPLCRACGDKKNRKARARSAARRAEGHYSPSIRARWSNEKRARAANNEGVH